MDLTLAEPDIAVGASTSAMVDGEKKPQRERRQHTPPEELYDLSQPIPKVCNCFLLNAGCWG